LPLLIVEKEKINYPKGKVQIEAVVLSRTRDK
jgi:hypothetical protein